jgi:hypothetical protein
LFSDEAAGWGLLLVCGCSLVSCFLLLQALIINADAIKARTIQRDARM